MNEQPLANKRKFGRHNMHDIGHGKSYRGVAADDVGVVSIDGADVVGVDPRRRQHREPDRVAGAGLGVDVPVGPAQPTAAQGLARMFGRHRFVRLARCAVEVENELV